MAEQRNEKTTGIESVSQKELELLRRELEVIKREKEVLMRENKLYQKIEEFESYRTITTRDGEDNSGGQNKDSEGAKNTNESENDRGGNPNDCVTENCGANDRNNSAQETNDSNAETPNDRSGRYEENVHNSGGKDNEIVENGSKTSFGLLKELLPEYDGSISPTIFVAQLKNISSLYSLNANTMKALLMSKVKGRAQSWLHSKINYVRDDFDVLLNELIDLFGDKENKLTIRRRFESRKWQMNEDFLSYYNDKIILAGRLDIFEDELIDYIIEGIPDENLQFAVLQE